MANNVKWPLSLLECVSHLRCYRPTSHEQSLVRQLPCIPHSYSHHKSYCHKSELPWLADSAEYPKAEPVDESPTRHALWIACLLCLVDRDAQPQPYYFAHREGRSQREPARLSVPTH